MNIRALMDILDSLEGEYISLWERVCNIESPTSFKKGIDAVGKVFIDLAKARGFEVEVYPLENAGDPICITLNPHAEGQPVVFSGHIDTVHPLGLFGTPAVKIKGDKIYGPGVADCKGGVVASFMAMDALYKWGYSGRPVKLIIQTDEETSSKNSGKKTVDFMCDRSNGAAAFFNCEPTVNNTVRITRKGIVRYTFDVRGIACHSSVAYKGANAVAEAASKILKLEEMKDPDGLTCNCGVINGGTVPNSVAERCTFTADIRFASEEQLKFAADFVKKVAEENRIEGCSCEVTEISRRPAMELSEKNIQLVDKLNEIFKKTELPTITPVAGLSGSDAAYITRCGIPCVDGIGVTSIRIHSEQEASDIYSLKQTAKQLAAAAYFI